MATVLPFALNKFDFDDEATRMIGEAFNAACGDDLHNTAPSKGISELRPPPGDFKFCLKDQRVRTTSARSRVKPALNADLDPTGLPFRFPDCPGRQGFKFGYSLIAVIDTHCCSGKWCRVENSARRASDLPLHGRKGGLVPQFDRRHRELQAGLTKVAGFDRNGWPTSVEIGGRIALEISGRFASDYPTAAKAALFNPKKFVLLGNSVLVSR